ncbi:MAG: hypothetical protein KDE46_30895, partial [Caldilineaceae bacterium]|nr:hypothetical protein [Caldilineaceae bacterium]
VYLIDPRLNTGGLIIYDISTPATPTFLGELLMPASQIAVGGSYAYITGSAEWGLPELYVVDVSTPSQPTIVATISYN